MSTHHLDPATLEVELERYLTEQWKPGDVLPSERELAELYGSSRHSVRTALQRLASRGIISTRAGARSRVNTPNQAAVIAGQFLRRAQTTVDELYEARAVVEAGAAAILARRVALGTLPANKLNDLVDILDQLDDLAAPGAPNYESPGLIVALHRRDLDLRFHLRIVELVANNITSGAEHSILAPFHDYPSLWSEPEDVSAWQSEHRTILKALLEGDAPNAALHILGHLEKGSRRLTHLLFGAAAGPRTPNDVQHTATPAALTLPPTPTTSPPRANRLRPKGQAARR